MRFGVALAKVRSKCRKAHIQAARKFLRRARKHPEPVDSRHRINKMWMDGADLKPVFNYLSQ